MYKIIAVILFLIPSCDSVDEKISADISKLQNLKVYEFPKEPDTIGWEYERSLNLNNTDKDYLIGQIGSINFYKENYIFISDPIKNCIHVFDWEGNYVKNLGRKGRGPGEFMQISMVKVIDDTLYVLDIITYQLHLFSIDDLSFLRTTNIVPKKVGNVEELDGYLPRLFIIKSNGNLLIGFGKTININKAEEERMLLFYEANKSGEIISDQIIGIKDRIYLSTSSNSNANPLIASFPFLPVSRIMDFTRDEIIFYRTDNFLIKKYSDEGKYLSSFYYKYPREKIDRDIVEKEYPTDYHQKIIKENKLPNFWPILSSVYLDDENRFWVSMYSNPNKNNVKYLILDSSGKLIGQFELSKKYALKNIRGDNFYVINNSNPFVLKEYSINF